MFPPSYSIDWQLIIAREGKSHDRCFRRDLRPTQRRGFPRWSSSRCSTAILAAGAPLLCPVSRWLSPASAPWQEVCHCYSFLRYLGEISSSSPPGLQPFTARLDCHPSQLALHLVTSSWALQAHSVTKVSPFHAIYGYEPEFTVMPSPALS